MDIEPMYQLAEDACIPILPACIPETSSMCIQTDDLRCYIGLDLDVMDDAPTLAVHLAHELGHCVTGSFYNRWAACDLRQKHENTANKWAIAQLIPKSQYDDAINAGLTEVWQLADYFGVTEEFMRMAVCWYANGNLAVNQFL